MPSMGAPSATPEPTASPVPTPTSTPSPKPTPTPTPIEIVPTAPQRSIKLNNVGVDDRMAAGVPRFVNFNTDGPSIVTAAVSNATGQVRLCLWQEPQRDEAVCRSTRNGSVQSFTVDPGLATWTASVFANGSTPTIALEVDFNANAPSVTLDSFRWSGTDSGTFNGFDAVVNSLAAGDMAVQGSFDDGADGSYDYHLVIQPLSGDPLLDQLGGPSQSFDSSQAVDQGDYRVTLSDPDPVANPTTAVIVTTTISWP